jgi:sugar phosphate isomerase/epimerase
MGMTTTLSPQAAVQIRPEVQTRPMPVGVTCGSRQGFAPGRPVEVVEYAASRGFDGIAFATPAAVSPTLDPHVLRSVRDLAGERGLYLESGVGCLGPFGDSDGIVADIETMIEANLALGCRQFFAYTKSDRHHAEGPHAEQLATIGATMTRLAPRLREEGMRLNLKTHEDLSSQEVLHLVEQGGTDVFGVSLDVANLVVRGEDPIAATERLAPYVHQTHLEDVVLYLVEDGLRRKLRPCGSGILDWSAIVRIVQERSPAQHLTIEQHMGQFGLAIFDPQWFDAEPHATAREIAGLFHGAVQCERRAARGDLPSLEDLGEPSTEDDLRSQLDLGVNHLRQVLETIHGGHSGSRR